MNSTALATKLPRSLKIKQNNKNKNRWTYFVRLLICASEKYRQPAIFPVTVDFHIINVQYTHCMYVTYTRPTGGPENMGPAGGANKLMLRNRRGAGEAQSEVAFAGSNAQKRPTSTFTGS